MRFDPRSLILFGTNVLLLYLMQLLNSALAEWSLYLFLLGPMVILPTLYLRHSAAFLCTLLTGLWVDAALPAPFGWFTLSFLVANAILFQMRLRFRPEHNDHPVLLAHIANFLFFVALSLGPARELASEPAYWLRIVTDLLLSHGALLIIAPWFFQLERLLFDILRVETEPENLPFS